MFNLTLDFCYWYAKIQITNNATSVPIEVQMFSEFCSRDSGVGNDLVEAVDSKDASFLMIHHQPILMNRSILYIFTKYLHSQREILVL